MPVAQRVAGTADGRFRAASAEVVSFGGPNMKFLALVEYAILTVASCTAYSQTVPAGRAQLIVSVDLGELPESPIFWHLYNYPTRAAAEVEAAKAPRATVVEAFDKVWLYSLAAKDWHPVGGEHVADIGPLPTKPGTKYTARYMEAVFTAGMKAAVHRHSGPEAWYLLTGSQCLETPEGMIVAHAGDTTIVPEGPPMALNSVGIETRRSVLLVLHDTAQPWITMASDWQPKGLCPQ
jgi:quercetin dioxygenase-like cupin family protein